MQTTRSPSVESVNGWQRTTDFLALRRNTSLLLVALVLALTGEKLWLGFAPKYLETLGAGIFIIGLFDAPQLFQREERANEGLLRHFFGFMLVPDTPRQEYEQRLLIPLHEHSEMVRATAAAAFDVFPISPVGSVFPLSRIHIVTQ